jgi:hypothetical protein
VVLGTRRRKIETPVSAAPPVGVLFPIMAALAFAACSTTTDDSLETRFGDRAGPVTVCHIPPGDPDNADTIIVDGPAVDGHLGHGDTLGPCPTPCELKCDDVAAAVQDFCENAPPLPEELPPDFCEQAASIVESSCDASCPEPTPEECSGFCSDIAAETHMACFEIIPDPFICEVGADVTYQECVAAFECPPPPAPPPNCYDDCFVAFNQAIEACYLAGGDPACVFEAENELFVCEAGCCVEDCNAHCEMQCAGDPECLSLCQEPCPQLCEPPPPPPPPSPCYDDCFLAFDQAIQVCDTAGADPACYMEAENALFACEAGCCVEDCNANCEMQCAGDPECLSVCQEPCPQLCEPPPPPPPPSPCYEDCFFAFDQATQACFEAGGDPTCLAAAENEFLTCEAGCCVEDCNAQCEMQCGGDPECLASCQEPCPQLCG